MPLYLESFGLDFLNENEESFRGMVAQAAEEGEAIVGYYDLPYFNHHYGKVQFILRTKRRDADDGYELTGIDSHARGCAIWEARMGITHLNPDDADKLTRKVTLKKTDGTGGAAVVSIVNADVLPSFMTNDIVRLQMIGLPDLIHYYADEDEYADDQPKYRNGKALLLEEGVVFPNGLLKNRNPYDPHYGEDDHLDDVCHVRGPVKSLRYGVFELNGEKYNLFLFCTIETQFGPLEIVHTIEQVDEKERDNLRVGAIVSFYGTISGDAAIDEYAHGIIRDEEHDLALLRYSMCEGDPERLRSVLLEDAVYETYYRSCVYRGADEIIKRIAHVQETLKSGETSFYARMATITDVDETNGPLEYGVGKRCLVLSYDRENDTEALAFVNTDDEGKISRLLVTNDQNYRFELDPVFEEQSIFDGMNLPDSVAEPILARARLLGVIEASVEDEVILKNSSHEGGYRDNILQMMEAMPETEDEEQSARYHENMFGYLFAKATEMEYAKKQEHRSFDLICGYSPEDAWEGLYSSNLGPEQQAVLEEAMDLGKLFYKDFVFYQMNNQDVPVMDTLTQALMLVQILGRSYADICFGSQERTGTDPAEG